MKIVGCAIAASLISIGILVAVAVKSAIANAAVFMDDSFRWGGRDDL